MRLRGRTENDDTIYRSKSGARRIRQRYRDLLEDLPVTPERHWLETDHGVTHTLIVGNDDAPPVFVFQGGNSVNPITLEWCLPLTEQFRLIAPDTPGHPGFSAPTRLSPYERDYADWVEAILDALSIERARMVGISYGAGIVLRTATYTPGRIERAGLLVPAGLGTGPLGPLLRDLVWPAFRYRWFPSQANLDRVLSVLFTEPVDELDEHLVDAVATSLREVRLDRRMPPAATTEELADFDAPTLVAAATEDILFPQSTVLPRAKRVINSLEVVMRLDGEAHVPSPAARQRSMDYLATFLTDA